MIESNRHRSKETREAQGAPRHTTAGALLNLAVGILCALGWTSLMVFNLLFLSDALEVAPTTEKTITLALFPFALSFPLAPEMIGRGLRDLGPMLATLAWAALIWALTAPALNRITDWAVGITDRLLGEKPAQ